jgi:RNA polymerase sigma-70 factor (ECF subfamily)
MAQMAQLARDWTWVQPVVAAFIRGLVPRHHDAEDVLQSTAVALVHRYADYDPSRPFVAFAIGVARFEVLRFRRKTGRQRATFDTDAVEAVAAAFEEVAPVVGEVQSALWQCVERLQGRVREVFALHYVEGLEPGEIAVRVGRPASAVSVALHRGRTAVRDCLERRLLGKAAS